jgi:MarR family transcriptional regulator, transcriptional regulator for hemolysin
VRPTTEPIGLEVTRTGRLLNRAFDDELVAAGGSLPAWLIVTALKRADHTMQREIAAAIGIEDATLTHHLNRMENAGHITRHRAAENRRTQRVALTDTGEALFSRMLTTVIAFDQRLRQGFTDDELDLLRALLKRLRTNVAAASPTS